MSTILNSLTAEKHYHAGHDLFQQGLYDEALNELRRAEDAFRMLDAKGHPFSNPLADGVSGLAATLAVSGQCYQKLGNYKKALTCYETSFINSKFEKRKPFREFCKKLSPNMIFCYEKEVENTGLGTQNALLSHEPEIDISFQFPFSLAKDAIPFARLYELAPEQYRQFGDFYRNARQKDANIRSTDKETRASAVKRLGCYIWGMLLAIWVVYGLIVVDALIKKK
jgi:tetratricopeptide (TPR) repeat protein